jgi:hypothetical protein
MPTLNAFDNGDIRTTILITTADVVGSLQARDYKGVGNQYVAENKLIISYPIQDGRDMNKEQNGIGLGGEDDPSYTLDRTGAQAVAYAIQGTTIGRSDTSGPQGKGYGEENDPMFTIDTVSGHGVATIFSHTQGLDAQPSETVSPTLRAGGSGMAVSYSPSGFADYSEGVGTLKAGMTNNNSPLAVDIYNHSVSDINQTLRKGNGGPDHTGTIFTSSNVRRLTPVECERLQGFPDDWTGGQSDSARYKQMGNAVAVPVVEWLIGNICDTL